MKHTVVNVDEPNYALFHKEWKNERFLLSIPSLKRRTRNEPYNLGAGNVFSGHWCNDTMLSLHKSVRENIKTR
jgi:hypothetical protein